ncbi:hypothetical protein M0651_12975 [Paenibacillus sp. MBLB2552]|uniref:Uncharacterized protein n=1 Tax=Paenibacillus mellifer TaxID=2937794 RepID=A0A9X2BQ90_9BACL|nr:hypothetical protein [Paenibacillus mellifer]MCK8488088.1 hypothetical protein [Paenibacillus mellifer]
MNPYRSRMGEIVHRAAEFAWRQPLLASGLWFHGDIRDNYYYASYLFAAAIDPEKKPSFDRVEGRRLSEQVLLRVLLLQDREAASPMYGHWPLGLDPAPELATPHVLPVELMGSLMVYFVQNYGQHLSLEVSTRFEEALSHVYRSGFYRKPLREYNHHEAKYTAAKLIFGQRYEDAALLADGRECLRQTLAHIRLEGMAEYGALPWFWHWIQAFTCAWALMEDTGVKDELTEMLDHLWNVRAVYYFKGAWVGARARGWPHDAPRDANVLHDYVQFGDFVLPAAMPRTEYAGLLFYEAPLRARQRVLGRNEPAESRAAILKEIGGVKHRLHSYAYLTGQFGVGGLWERVEEFDNEQLRWLFSLPVRGEKGNQLYFFHPGKGYDPAGSDPRHQSGWTDVLYHKNVVMSLYTLPEDVTGQVNGVLPEGEWLFAANGIFGKVEETYFAVSVSSAYQIQDRDGYLQVVMDGRNVGIVVEALGDSEATQRGIADLDEFASALWSRAPQFEVVGSAGRIGVAYVTYNEEAKLSLRVKGPGLPGDRWVNGVPVDLKSYSYSL